MTSPVDAISPAVVAQVATLLEEAQFVLVAAGAGMSVDAGFDYTSERQFVERYPVLSSQGPRCRYHVFGYDWASEAQQWGHLARHLEQLRYSPPPIAAPYEQLQSLTRGKDRFVLTSNADDLFERTGFDPERIWTRQGSYSRLQCLAPCDARPTWLAQEWVRSAVPQVSLETEEFTNPSLLPRCPACGGKAMLNVRGGDWFVEDPYLPQGERFGAWLEGTLKGRLVVLDIGTGFNTPVVIRIPAEQIVGRHPNATLVRVNKHHPHVPPALRGRALSIASEGARLWAALSEATREGHMPRREPG